MNSQTITRASIESDQPLPKTQTGSGHAVHLLLALIVAYTFSFLDRQILSLLVEPIKRDLAISDTAVSLLQGFAFALLLALGGIPVGRYVDSGHRLRLVSAGIALWSLMTAGCALARSYPALLLCRMGVGLGEATLTPAAYSLIGDAFRPRRLGLALGLYSMGVYIGGGLALLLGALVIAQVKDRDFVLPLLGRLHGWQMVFLAVGVPGLLVSAWIASLREPARRGAGARVRPPLAEVLRYFRQHARSLVCLYLAMSFAAMMNYSTNAWVPSMLIRSYGWTAVQAGRSYGLVVLIFGVLGVIAGGLGGDALVARGYKAGRLTLMGCAALAAAPFIAMAPLMSTPQAALALLAPATLFVTMVIGCGPATLQELMPNRMRGTASALGVLVVNLIGLGLGPTCIALIGDYLLHDPRRIGQALAIAAPPMLLLSAALSFGGRRAYAAGRDRLLAAG
ncbi:MAG: transporter [Hydrocarboniphaga sp.]|uniref:MFS transporter n=1 Tax=Hydrocarboniphaga sp. TaxID=2033016 RepID=UPI002633442F|nr:MFS transporter [Hydrocarboniphaga sp.]MDB5968976.1 transporter [Hydrocarboniphaga sp.]